MAEEAAQILEVTENAHKAALYRFQLVQFPRQDILGLSIGNHQIFISYELSRLAYEQKGYRWLFRQTLAHEIAHDVLGKGSSNRESGLNSMSAFPTPVKAQDLSLATGTSFRNYSRTSELAADRKAMEYWQKIGWDCRIWINIFKSFLDEGYMGDVHHPTKERLSEAIRMCHSEAS